MIVITGAAGFIGSHVANFYHKNHRLILVDKPIFFRERGYVPLEEPQLLDWAKDKLPVSRHKVVDLEYFPKVLEKISASAKDPNAPETMLIPPGERIECIIHMGACTDTGETNWEYLQRVNIEYTKSLWNWCARERVPLIYASSGATYGAGEEGFSDHPGLIPRLKPLNLYGKSKHDFDLWVLDEVKNKRPTPPYWYGLKFFNVFGPHEGHKGGMASAVLHSFHQVTQKGSCNLFRSHKKGVNDGEQRRDFIFVDDIVSIIDFLRTQWPTSGIYNCGTSHSRTFLDLANALFKSLDLKPKINWIDTPERYRAAYQYYTQAEIERLRNLGYHKPFTSLEEGVQKYVDYLCSSSHG